MHLGGKVAGVVYASFHQSLAECLEGREGSLIYLHFLSLHCQAKQPLALCTKSLQARNTVGYITRLPLNNKSQGIRTGSAKLGFLEG